jgi:large subunit ribosomal protein L10
MAAEWKKRLVKQYAKYASQYNVICVLNLHKMPTPALQQMKQKMDDAVIVGGRKRLFKRALDQVKEKPGLKEIEKYLEEGMPALLFTSQNPFLLYKKLSKGKMPAAAKPGEIAPKEIVVPAGPTSFAPGPIIGELGRFGIKTSVEGGKVAVKEDSVVAKKGDVISGELSSLLLRMGIQPMEIGLDLVAAYENGLIFGKDVLKVDEAAFLASIENAARHVFNLAMNAGIMTRETTSIMIIKAFNDSKALAREANIMADAVAAELVAKAEAQAKALSRQLDIKVEAPAEEKKEEAPKAAEEAKKEIRNTEN